MSDLTFWSTNPSSGHQFDTPPPDGQPEGMLAGQSNDANREVMASVKRHLLLTGLTGLGLAPSGLLGVDVSPGACLTVDGLDLIQVGATWNKQLAGPWASGSGMAGLDTGSVTPSTLYAVWAITRTDTHVADVLFSTSFTEAGVTFPTGYTKGQRIGAVYANASSQIAPFVQMGDVTRYLDDPIIDVDDSVLSTSIPKDAPLSVPPYAMAHVYLFGDVSAGTDDFVRAWLYTAGATNTINLQQAAMNFSTTVDALSATTAFQVMTSAAREVSYAMAFSGASPTIQVRTFGYTDIGRGRAT